MSVSFFVCLPTTFAVLGKSEQKIHGWKRLFKGKVISYEPTCSHKQCDRIGAITTLPTLYIPLYKALYTLRLNLLTKSSH